MVHEGIAYKLLPVPPKYFEDFNDTKFDPIRHNQWFRTITRRWYNARGYELMYNEMKEKGWGINETARIYKIDRKYLQLYFKFSGKIHMAKADPKCREYQRALDDSYEAYCHNRAVRSIHRECDEVCSLYGISSMKMYRFWEFDANFLPTVLKTDDMAQGT